MWKRNSDTVRKEKGEICMGREGEGALEEDRDGEVGKGMNREGARERGREGDS